MTSLASSAKVVIAIGSKPVGVALNAKTSGTTPVNISTANSYYYITGGALRINIIPGRTGPLSTWTYPIVHKL
jgi:hypothetical protein